ncbi:MAG: hypothetical protein KatS3mg005_2284 [Bryobacteraceae bacterium]|nr:MAG: hypothetical protein KatS3mg005_2284 [Bryobacteraceae bacterium]
MRSRLVCLAALLSLLGLSACRRKAEPPQSSIRFEPRRFEKTLPGCGDQTKRSEPCVSFHVAWPEAAGGAPAETLARINAAILAALQPLEAPRGFDAEADEWIRDYQRFHAEFPDSGVTYFARRVAEVVFSSPGLITIEIRTDEFHGGPEPESRRAFLNLSPSTGKPVELDELLEPGGRNDLLRLAEWRFRSERHIPQDSALADAGFTFEQNVFALPRHWGFTSRGLLLHYNAGEVAPASIGPTTLLAPWNELRGIVSAKAGILPR